MKTQKFKHTQHNKNKYYQRNNPQTIQRNVIHVDDIITKHLNEDTKIK